MPLPPSADWHEDLEYADDDWHVFSGDDDDDNDVCNDGSGYDEGYSVATDDSPTDVVMNFRKSNNKSKSEQFDVDREKARRARRYSAIGNVGEDITSKPPNNINNGSRRASGQRTKGLPRKHKSLEGERKSNIAAYGSSQNTTRGNSSSRGPVRRGHSDLGDRLQQRNTIRSRRESMGGGRRESMGAGGGSGTSTCSGSSRNSRRSLQSAPDGRGAGIKSRSQSREHLDDSSKDHSDRRSSNSNHRKPKGGTRSSTSSNEDRLARLKELGSAYKAATILEKSISAKTDHLKKDIPL